MVNTDDTGWRIGGAAVWIPVVRILYSLPGPLQIPLFGHALSLWVMLLTWMSERRQTPR